MSYPARAEGLVSMGNGPIVNDIARLEYELAYVKAAVQRISQYTTENFPNRLKRYAYIPYDLRFISSSSSSRSASMSCSSKLNGLWYGRLVVVQLLFSSILLSGIIKTGRSILVEIPSYVFSPGISLEFKYKSQSEVLTWIQLRRIPVLFYLRNSL